MEFIDWTVGTKTSSGECNTDLLRITDQNSGASAETYCGAIAPDPQGKHKGRPITKSLFVYLYKFIWLVVSIFIYLFVYLSVYMSAYLSVYMSVYLSSIYLFICLFVCLSIYPSINHLSRFISVCVDCLCSPNNKVSV